ncbi:unnamed protein product [Chrysodeixis includens]|uniref:Uncharacterized protein n=1 Tax=Chrysodeixis includens TaxID=689277 RepID=A0A9N8Q088_CHRIL|nr:unnamed protein product [Chrysodeixis includens]
MKRCSVFIVLCLCLCVIKSSSSDRAEPLALLKSNSTSEQKGWNIKLDIFFSKTLPTTITRAPKSDVRLKCEAIMNYTKVEKYTKNKGGIATLSIESPPDHIQQKLLENVKVYWLKDNKVIDDNSTQRIRIITRIDKTNGTIGTNLRIKDIAVTDKGNYTCVIKQNYEKKQTSQLKVEEGVENYEIPTYASLFPNTDIFSQLDINVESTPVLMSENIQTVNSSTTNSTVPQRLEPLCQEYLGNVCAEHLKGQFVFIPYNTSQAALEDKLLKAFQVTKYSNDISPRCEGYAVPSLCYSTFPICRDPFVTNRKFYSEARKLLSSSTDATSKINEEDLPEIVFENYPIGKIPNLYSNSNGTFASMFDFRHNSTVLRRVCKQDCEILENELCQKEYAIAKRHPHIGQQLTLEECQDLPEDDPDCLRISIGAVMVSDDECYWENGSGYLGRVNVAGNGMTCVEWSKQLHVRLSDYPELAGTHSYCRNPGGVKDQPWCIIEKDGKTDKALCDIPNYSNQEVISMVRGGELLAAPACCPPAMYSLMRDCWKHTPQRRPNFEEIVNRIQEWINMGGCPETAVFETAPSSSTFGHRPSGSSRDLQERVPLLPPHCSSSNGSLATGSLKKFSAAGSSSKVTEDNCSTCSEVGPPLVPKTKKHSSGSLIDTDKVGTKDTVVRIPNTQFGNEI